MILNIVLILVTMIVLGFCVLQGIDSIQQAKQCKDLYKQYGDKSFMRLRSNFIFISVGFFMFGAVSLVLIFSLVFA